ncbi:unnamed protein product [Taenia asiatica]|uniref:Uncharacterized protein n=1 Tax=Taenia asiatica TaxID=60517 RepID=A0A0R3VT46_TAEAS|nr:unnamed protein product [Taenia asiatica]
MNDKSERSTNIISKVTRQQVVNKLHAKVDSIIQSLENESLKQEEDAVREVVKEEGTDNKFVEAEASSQGEVASSVGVRDGPAGGIELSKQNEYIAEGEKEKEEEKEEEEVETESQSVEAATSDQSAVPSKVEWEDVSAVKHESLERDEVSFEEAKAVVILRKMGKEDKL